MNHREQEAYKKHKQENPEIFLAYEAALSGIIEHLKGSDSYEDFLKALNKYRAEIGKTPTE